MSVLCARLYAKHWNTKENADSYLPKGIPKPKGRGEGAG